MADTSLQTFGSEISADLDQPVTRRHWTIGRAWRSSSLGARLLAVLGVASVVGAILTDRTPVHVGIGVVALVPAALVDVLDRRLPNRMVGGAAIALVLAAGIAMIGSGELTGLDGVALGAGFMAGPLLVMHLVSPSSMGFGDVKAAIVLGASLGWVNPQLGLVALLVASGSTALIGLALRHRHLPFGPGLLAGTVLALWCAPLVPTTDASTVAPTRAPIAAEDTR